MPNRRADASTNGAALALADPRAIAGTNQRAHPVAVGIADASASAIADGFTDPGTQPVTYQRAVPVAVWCTDACADGPCLEAAAAEFAAKLVAAAADPSTPIIAVVSEITFDGDVLLVAEGTGARAEFELGFAAAMASSLGDGELGHSRARGTLLR